MAFALLVAAGLASSASPEAAGQAASAPCDSWEVEYALAGNLALSDTPMGQGDGIYGVGPGKLVLRFDDHDGQPAGRAKLLHYELHQAFAVSAKTLFWKTTVTNDAMTRVAADPCSSAEGSLAGTALAWNTAVRDFHTDGTLHCDGSFCGKFGAPPPGDSEFHLGPNTVLLSPFRFGADMKSFTMASTFVSKSESPKQTAHLALSGREVARTCVAAKKCP